MFNQINRKQYGHPYLNLIIWFIIIFANWTFRNISRVFNFAKSRKISEIRENMYPQKFLLLRYGTEPYVRINNKKFKIIKIICNTKIKVLLGN